MALWQIEESPDPLHTVYVYKKYDQAGLDRQYNNRGLVPEFDLHLAFWDESSRATELTQTSIKNIPYGSLPSEILDIYPTEKPSAKTLIFIHGGYWQMMNKSNFQFIGSAFLPYDFTTILISYPLAPSVTMDKIIASCKSAVEWVYHNISNYNGNRGSIYLAGHSAGGHLAAMMMTREFGPKQVKIKGICGLSGLYNLAPIQLSFVNQALHMGADLAASLSPVLLNPVEDIPLLLAVGEKESDEYHAQLNELSEKWSPRVQSIQRITATGLNHFTILNEFAKSHSIFHRQFINWINQ